MNHKDIIVDLFAAAALRWEYFKHGRHPMSQSTMKP